jgi:pilus assembly protein Flp/PilA
MRNFVQLFVRDERGVSALEYAVLAGIVVLALGAVGTFFNTSIQTMFTTMFADVTTAQTPATPAP